MSQMLAALSIALAIFGYLDQELRCHAPWDWSQFWHHEPLIVICASIAVALVAGKYLERR